MDKETLLTIIDDLTEKLGLEKEVILHMIESGKIEELMALKNKEEGEYVREVHRWRNFLMCGQYLLVTLRRVRTLKSVQSENFMRRLAFPSVGK